jgi:hypothetical protein
MAAVINPLDTVPFWTSLSGDNPTSQTTFSPAVGGAMPIACTFTGLYLRLFGDSGTAGSDTITVTLFKNHLATIMTASATNPAAGTYQTLASDTIHTIPAAVGDTFSIGYVQTNATPAVRIAVGTRCQ